jgi:Na+/H+ antiporter NhaD/arsenite permease-like protein
MLGFELSLPVVVFVLVYIGMALGRIPGLAIDRTGVALLGLIALLATGTMSLDEAGASVDMPTIALLFALMILSAQFEMSGFYALVAERVTLAAANPRNLLLTIVLVTGVLAALLSNDVVVFALTPLICTGLLARGIDARPYLVALAGAANAGSAATLIGNPQNILIGQAGGLPFWQYIQVALPPVLFSLIFVYWAVLWTWRGRFTRKPNPFRIPETMTEVDRLQLGKGILAVGALIGLFLTPLPRELSALAVAGFLLLSRRLSSREMIGAADWHLLLLFACLFAVTAAFENTGIAQEFLADLAGLGLGPERLSVLAPLLLAASNTIGNVPTIILILQILPDLPHGVLTGMALLSTFAGNLLLTGSLCNIIVAERAASAGSKLTFLDFARSGIVMTLASMAVTVAWLWLIGAMAL